MMPHVVSTLGWLPNPLARNVGRFFLHLPDTPDVIKLRCFLKNLPPLIIHIFQLPDSHCALINVEIIGASCLATGLPSRSSFSLIISFSSRVRAHPIWLVVNHRVVSSGWERRSVLISGMVYTTSPPHVSSPRPTYRGCAGDIRTPYIRLPHSTPSSCSSSFSSSSCNPRGSSSALARCCCCSCCCCCCSSWLLLLLVVLLLLLLFLSHECSSACRCCSPAFLPIVIKKMVSYDRTHVLHRPACHTHC
jgi:hypothetical protein